jgi:hypothetical protein
MMDLAGEGARPTRSLVSGPLAPAMQKVLAKLRA